MALTHEYFAFYIDDVLVVDYQVQDCFSHCAVFILITITVDAVIPIISVVLSTEDDRTFLAIGVDDLQKGIRFRFREASKAIHL